VRTFAYGKVRFPLGSEGWTLVIRKCAGYRICAFRFEILICAGHSIGAHSIVVPKYLGCLICAFWKEIFDSSRLGPASASFHYGRIYLSSRTEVWVFQMPYLDLRFVRAL
jgi:hypothetical protein